MTSVREDLGFIEKHREFRKPAPAARYEGLRDLGDEGWEAQVLKADGRRCWFFAPSREAAIAKARNYVAAINDGRVTP